MTLFTLPLKKYQIKMVTEKEVLKFMREDAVRPLKRKELARVFNINADDYRFFRQLVKDMVQGGTLIKIKGGRYGIPEKMNLITGALQCHPDGFGFVIPEKGHEGSETNAGDIHIRPRKMKDAMHGDKVVCRVESRGYKGREEGRIIRIVERRYETLVGIFERAGSFGFVIPNERRITKDIYIPNKFTGKARRGQAVVVEITQYPGAGHNPEGKIIEILGYPDNPEVEIEMIIRSHGLFKQFSGEALEEAERIPFKISDKEPLYVIEINAEKNEIIVGPKENLIQKKIKLKNINILANPKEFLDEVFVKV
ncbi:MAG: hypothetical protein QGG87_05055, partial [Nitrospinota bacterium]|nr:hypothetical protein [Nitrospinota bacterium]